MLDVEYPECPCGSASDARPWVSNGGCFGGDLSQAWFRCGACGRAASHVRSAGGGMFLVPREGTEISGADHDWFDEVVMAVWRTRAEQIEAAREAFLAPLRARCGMPAFPWQRGVTMTEEDHDLWCAIDTGLRSLPGYRWPTGFEVSPPPPRLPTSLLAWVADSSPGRHGDGVSWIPVDHAAVADLPVPEDPILVRHEARFARIFAEVGQALGTPLPTPRKVTNWYHPRNTRLEPWYEFSWRGHEVTVGHRRHVDTIEIVPPAPAVQTVVAFLGKRDQVTHYGDEDHEDHDGTVGLHAWSHEKMVEYLTATLGAL